MSHCIIDEVIEVKKEKVEVTMKYHQAASNIPAEITHGGCHRCTIELIHRTLPQRQDVFMLCCIFIYTVDTLKEELRPGLAAVLFMSRT